MTTTYGLTATGFAAKTYTEITAELEAAFQGVFGVGIDLSPQGPFGQMIGIMAEREASVWDAAQDVYGAFDPDSSTGQALDAVCALTGTLRAPATHGTVTLTLTGTTGVTVPAGSVASVVGTEVQWATDADATFAAGTATTTATAVLTGPLPAPAGHLTVIDTPVAGWTAVTNGADAVPGSYEENDAALRMRREEELRNPSNAALDAIRTKVLDVMGVTGCVVFENCSMVTDVDGIPPKAVEIVISPNTVDPDLLSAAILGCVAAGIETHGSDGQTETDSQGIVHDIGWTWATVLPVYVHATITYDADIFPVSGEQDAKDAILLWGTETLVMGKDVVGRAIGSRIFPISGVLDAMVLVGTTGPGAASSVAVGIREIATLDSARVTITLVPGTP